MRKRKSNFLIYVLAFSVIILAVGFIYKFTNGFTEDFKTFYVEYNDEKIFENNNKLTLSEETEHVFNVSYTFDGVKKKTKEYTVKIVPNADSENTFDFTVNGITFAYHGENDLTSAFDIKTYNNCFRLTLPKGLTVESVLKSLYPDDEVILDEKSNDFEYPFKIVVTSYNEKAVCEIIFKVANKSLDDENSDTQGGITFRVGATVYSADEGMTWREWVLSEYNTSGYIIQENDTRIYTSRSLSSCLQYGEIDVNSDSPIISNGNYFDCFITETVNFI